MYIVYLAYMPLQIVGGNRVIFEQVRELSKRKHRVEIWSEHCSGRSVFEPNVSIKKYNQAELDIPDVVIACDPGFIKPIKEFRKTGTSYLLLQHDFEWIIEQSRIPNGIEIFDELKNDVLTAGINILTVSKWLTSKIAEQFELKPTLISNSVDTSLFKPSSPLINNLDGSILAIYDPQEWKNFTYTTDIIARLKFNHPRLKFMTISATLPSVEDVNLSYVDTWFINPRQDDLAKIYSSADIFLSTSLKEGFSLPGLEALACATSLVTTDNGGNRDYVKDGYNCVILDQFDIEGSVKKMEELLDNHAVKKLLIKNGLDTVKNYLLINSIDALENTFLSTIKT
ncbi:MAG: glycosyltransferase family 4 protein [Candidatus Saccharimonadales bacterium]